MDVTPDNPKANLKQLHARMHQGGFSYADVLDSAKGWAGTIRRNARLWQQFCAFYARCALRSVEAS